MYLFFRAYFVPFEVVPCDIAHLFQRSFQSEKHWWNASLGIALASAWDFAFISFIVEKRCPLSVYLSLGNRKKSQGARSGEWGGCGITMVSFFAKNCWMSNVVCGDALSW